MALVFLVVIGSGQRGTVPAHRGGHREGRVMLAAGQVMRYAPHTRAVKEIVDSGRQLAARRPGDLRCVYACDNDVVDHQVVALEFRARPRPRSPMTAFTKAARRHTRLFGTGGELSCDGETIRVYDFLIRAERLMTPPPAGEMTTAEGHSGGDAGNRELIMPGPRESLVRHLAVFAAERARLNGTVETIPPSAGFYIPNGWS